MERGMIRLAVCSADDATWRQVAPRLRGAAIDVCGDPAAWQPEAAANCDAVVILDGPPVDHATVEQETIEQWLRGGKHLLVAGDALAEHAALTTLAATALLHKARLAVVNPDRWLPSRQLIRQQLDTGKLGTPGLVRLHRWQPAEPQPFPEPRGALKSLPRPLIRDLDLALWLMGQPPELVYALEQPAEADASAACGRVIQVHLGFPGGGMALLDYTDRLPPGDGYQSLAVIGSAGAAHADDHQNVQLVYRGGKPKATVTSEGVRQLASLVQQFVDALRSGDELSPAAAWQPALAAADAVDRSLALHQAERLALP
jgi:predicted dehydrogenase